MRLEPIAVVRESCRRRCTFQTRPGRQIVHERTHAPQQFIGGSTSSLASRLSPPAGTAQGRRWMVVVATPRARVGRMGAAASARIPRSCPNEADGQLKRVPLAHCSPLRAHGILRYPTGHRSPRLLKQVRRVRRQVEAVERALEREIGCEDIMQLIAAPRASMGSRRR
jgi:hypothetical protein